MQNQLTCLGIYEPKGTFFGCCDKHRSLHHSLQDPVQIQQRGDRFGDAHQYAQFPDPTFQIAPRQLELAAQALLLAAKADLVQLLVDGCTGQAQVEGLDQIVRRTKLKGLDGNRFGAIGRHHDDRQVQVLLLHLFQDLESRDVGHLDIQQDQRRILFTHQA